MFGVIVGFSLAVVFVSNQTRPDWMPYSADHFHEVELKDPHTGHDLNEAAGPLEGVGYVLCGCTFFIAFFQLTKIEEIS